MGVGARWGGEVNRAQRSLESRPGVSEERKACRVGPRSASIWTLLGGRLRFLWEPLVSLLHRGHAPGSLSGGV